MNLGQDEIDRFEAKRVELERDDCWVWQGAKYQNGYGMVALRRGKRKTFSAHRIAWIIANGQNVPEGLMVCHKCDNRSCVNPNHLYVGTGKDNNTDTIIRNRGNRKIGEKCSWAKLSDNEALKIFHSIERQSVLARKYKVDPSTISQIKSGSRWKHLIRV